MALSPCQVLGVSPLADDEQLRTAFKKRVLETHPDKGGDVEEFRCVKEAYEALQKMRVQREKASQRQAECPKPGNAASNSSAPPPPYIEQMIFQLSERAQLRHPRPQRSMEQEIAAAFDSIPWRRVTVAAAAGHAAGAATTPTSSASQAASPKAKANATKAQNGSAGRQRSVVKGGAESAASAARSSSDRGSGGATCSTFAAPQSAAKRWQVVKARAASLPAEALWKYISQLGQSDEREKAIQSLNEATQSKLFQYLKERQSQRQHKHQKRAADQTATPTGAAAPAKVVPAAKPSGRSDTKPSGRKDRSATSVVSTAGQKGVAPSIAAKVVKTVGKRNIAAASTTAPPKSSSSSSSEESSSSSSESTEEFVVDEPVAAPTSLR